jgi:hypothetical protein
MQTASNVTASKNTSKLMTFTYAIIEQLASIPWTWVYLFGWDLQPFGFVIAAQISLARRTRVVNQIALFDPTFDSCINSIVPSRFLFVCFAGVCHP